MVLIVSLAFASTAVPGQGLCIEESYPHDPGAFTQGLVYYNGRLLESTGRYGNSSVRMVELETGRVLLQRSLPDEFFGEGLALHDGILYQLTWHNGLVLKYDPDTLKPLGRIPVDGEGWGLASDGERMVMSDGSAVLRFVDPENFTETGRVVVHDANGVVTRLNELEFVEGLLLANIYQSDEVVVIDPTDGRVVDRLDLSRYARRARAESGVDVTNGIAYLPDARCLLITGKKWPRLYKIALPAFMNFNK
jgi:glutamine cyclotransferase